jgi:hypothetical protein
MTSYLTQHPEILMCERKEAHVFGSDIGYFYRNSYTSEEYLQLFGNANPSTTARRVGEASVWYLYSKHAAEEMHAFSPYADIVVMLRNPVDMIHSLHSHFVYMGREPEEEFEAAIALDAARETGEVPRSFVPHSYRAAVRYGDQLERYIRSFGRERIHLILFEDFAADPAVSYRQLCSSLGVTDSFTPDFPVVNESKRVRSKRVRGLLQRPPKPVRKALRPFSTSAVRGRIFHKLTALNAAPMPKPPMSTECRQTLEAEFAPEIERLGNLLDRDLSGWTSSKRAPEGIGTEPDPVRTG